MRDYILFDLDGTLTDPGEGITCSVQHALVKLGITPPPRKELEMFISPPLDEAFRERFGLSAPQIEEAIFYFREYFKEEGIWQNLLFPGMPEFLTELKQNGKTLFVATTKPEVFAHEVLNRFELAPFFNDVVGSPLNDSGLPKAEIVQKVLQNNRLAPSAAVMVGDRRHDVIGGLQNGLATVGVLYGYGSRQEFEQAGADYIAEDLDELLEILCSPGL